MSNSKNAVADLLTVEQAAAALGLSVRMVRQHITNGSLHAQQFGRAWLLRRSDVERFTPKRRGRPKKND